VLLDGIGIHVKGRSCGGNDILFEHDGVEIVGAEVEGDLADSPSSSCMTRRAAWETTTSSF
jgi:hypothetical protein